MNKSISVGHINTIYRLVLSGTVNYKRSALFLNISRNTLKKYVSRIRQIFAAYPLQQDDFDFCYRQLTQPPPATEKIKSLYETFPAVLSRIKNNHSQLATEWQAYRVLHEDGLQRSQFSNHFSKWCKSHNIDRFSQYWQMKAISDKDLSTLKKWRRASNKMQWEKAVCVLSSFEGQAVKMISQHVARTPDTIRQWIAAYLNHGIKGLQRKTNSHNAAFTERIELKQANLMRLLHQAPKLYGINRASWSLLTLAQAYEQQYGAVVSPSSISEYLKAQGYSFRKAKETLTSPDPYFREKLTKVTGILSALTSRQKFFSIDEFGPFAVKIKGGRSYVQNSELKAYPQIQKSKGCIICTAALELSTNQVTHFYSTKKNTAEMIKLLEVLLVKYKGEEQLFFSWDAASWHASKELYKRIEEVNADAYRTKEGTPMVELVPLPSSAQFLNVIESVFSGLAKAIIHNSNYASAEECKEAIDAYFNTRNAYFLQHPKRAGNKIWGKELVSPVFDETKNCKDPKWR